MVGNTFLLTATDGGNAGMVGNTFLLTATDGGNAGMVGNTFLLTARDGGGKPGSKGGTPANLICGIVSDVEFGR